MKEVVQLSSDVFFRHEPIAVRLVSPQLNFYSGTIQSRHISKEQVTIEFSPPLADTSVMAIGYSIELKVRLPKESEPITLIGLVSRAIEAARDPEGNVLSLVGVELLHLSPQILSRLEAHEIEVKSRHSVDRSPRVVVQFEVQTEGIDVMSSLVVRDLSLTGMFVAGRARFRVGRTLNLRCRLPFQKDEIVLPGKVIWQGKKAIQGEGIMDGFGFQFVDLPSMSRTKLDNYYSRHAA